MVSAEIILWLAFGVGDNDCLAWSFWNWKSLQAQWCSLPFEGYHSNGCGISHPQLQTLNCNWSSLSEDNNWYEQLHLIFDPLGLNIYNVRHVSDNNVTTEAMV